MSRARSLENEETPLGYASRLAKYISDPSTIHARTLDYWGRAPTVGQCANLRARVEREKREYRKRCDERAARASMKDVSETFICGHERSFDNTYHVGNNEACRTCQRVTQQEMRDEIERQHERERLAADRRQVLVKFTPVEPPLLISGRERVLARAADLTGISVADITGPRRFKPIVRARYAAIHALRTLNYSCPQIASIVGMKDHTSVIHALTQVQERCKREPDFEELCLALEAAATVKPEPIPANVVDQFVREAA